MRLSGKNLHEMDGIREIVIEARKVGISGHDSQID
jgi:hypothetical protein